MSAVRPTAGRALVLQRLSGVVFLGVLAGLIALSIAFYQKAFTDVVLVELETDRIGNQLTPPSDVKVNGVIVGEARDVETTADGAIITLALEPQAASRLPSNVTARLSPKTLFGEKFVDLQLPDSPSGSTLAEGSVIPQDRTTAARETEQALNNLLPLLQTLDPESVSTTLNAVSTSLRGRGDRIGSNLVLARDYFREFNPELPVLQRNLRGLADFNDNLTAATPDIVRLLEDLSVVNRNLVRDEQALETFLRSTTAVSGTLEEFVARNERRFVQLAAEGKVPLELFAQYSPEFPCLAQGLTESGDFIGDAFGRLQPGLHITLEFIQDQGGYVPDADEPEYKDSLPPTCFGLPRPGVPAEDFNFLDGFRDDLPRETTGSPGDSEPASGGTSASPASFRSAAAPALGVPAERVPASAALLFGPVTRGTSSGSDS